jgi:FKBP-type peptidyl-prolyl cis-trans isomerase SlyD
MLVEDKKVVSLVYELRKDKKDGEVVESLNEDQPLVFLFGSGNLLPKFEENLAGLKPGDSFEFSLKSVDAYGEVQPNAVVDVPRSIFQVDGNEDPNLLKVGNTIPMLDREGNRLNGTVMEIGDETVKMDFNHPMAGQDLFFSGKITDIRDANEDELHHGHVHASGGCEGCDKDDCHGHHNH